MARKKYTTEQVVQFLRNVEIEQGRGAPEKKLLKKLESLSKLTLDGAKNLVV